MAMGGYNTVVEILTSNQRAVIVPRVHPRIEQSIRAERLAEKGLLDMLHPANLTPSSLFDAIGRSLQRPRPVRAQDMGIDLDGAAKVCAAVEQMRTNNMRQEARASGNSLRSPRSTSSQRVMSAHMQHDRRTRATDRRRSESL
jgi:predicted glycosyltransferase